MAKWSIKDLWGKHTEKKTLNPEMRDMLMSLDGVYEPKGADVPPPEADRDQPDNVSQRATK